MGKPDSTPRYRQTGTSGRTVSVGVPAAQPAVASVIAGATSAEQVRRNVAAGSWQPSPQDLAALDEVVPGPAPAG